MRSKRISWTPPGSKGEGWPNKEVGWWRRKNRSKKKNVPQKRKKTDETKADRKGSELVGYGERQSGGVNTQGQQV